MLQSFNVPKSDVTTSLPFENINDFSSRSSTADDALLNQSNQQRDSFVDAISQAKDEARIKNTQQRDESNARQSEWAQRQNELREQQRQNAQDKQQRLEEKKADQATTRNERSQERAAIDGSENSSPSNVDTQTSNKENVETNRVDAQDKKNSSAENTDVSANSEANISIETEDFNWVEHVTKVRTMEGVISENGVKSALDSLAAESKSDDSVSELFHLFFAEQNHDFANNEENFVLEVDPDSEFMTLKLNGDDVMALLKSNGIELEKDTELNADALAKLDKMITLIIQQLNEDGESEKAVNHADKSEKMRLDAELMKTALSGKDETQIEANVDITDSSILSPEVLETDKKAQLEAQALVARSHVDNSADEKSIKVKQSDINEQASTLVSTPDTKKQITEKTLLETAQNLNRAENGQEVNDSILPINNKVIVDTTGSVDVNSGAGISEDKGVAAMNVETNRMASMMTKGNETDLEQTKVNVITDKVPLEIPKKTSLKKSADVLVGMPDDKLGEAAENISIRIKEVVGDLKSDNKGAEFIAALQAGVKEFKEQLKLGREPGIDLKALVSEALSKSEISSLPAQSEIKLDKQLSQISNLLGAGHSISQAATQIASSAIGINELSLQKETNQAQVENARQLQQSNASDKGFNIVKPEGQQQLVDKVRWMVNNRNLTADIRLDPPDLGSMQIKIAMSGDAASVNFTVQSQIARDLLDQAAPQLRDMLEKQGIDLGESNINQGSQQQFADNENLGTGTASNHSNIANKNEEGQNNDGVGQTISEQRIVNGMLGGIDYYA